jgi:L-tyrosine isonitrile desaturase/decarboxylase
MLVIEPREGIQHVSELDIKTLREHFHREQLLVLRGFRTFGTSEEFSAYCEQWGEVSLWPFGKVLELIERENPEDHIFDNNYVPLHWDGMYRPMVPEYQIFHCVKAPLSGQGGRTTFSNTLSALATVSAEDKALWEKVTGIYKRKMEFYHSRTVSPVIVEHPYKNLFVIRYNEPPSAEKGHFLNPPELEFTGLDAVELDRFHKTLQKALYAPENFYAHEWKQGDIVIADNFSLLHGREAFAAKAPRHLQRVHVLSETPFKNPGLESYQ